MRKRFISLAITALLGAGALMGCAGETEPGTPTQSVGEATEATKDSLVVSVGTAAVDGNFDPTTGYGIYGYGLFHTALLTINNDIQTEPDLATEYTVSDDGLVYTFTVRDDVVFSDGEPLTPEDVVYTYETAKNSGSSVDLTVLDKAEVIDGKVQFTLNKPFSPFVRTVALLGIVPEHAHGDNYSQNPIGTGPLKLKQLDVDQQLIVEPNEHYYGQPTPFEQITFLAIDEESALATAASGQLDVVMINPEYATETVEGMHLVALDTADNRGFNLPTVPETTNASGVTVGNNVTADPAIREALNIGINRQEIIDNALNGIGEPSWVRFTGLPWANEEPGLTDGQVDEATALLEEAGWTDSDGDGVRENDGQRAEFRISGRSDDLMRYNLAVAFAENAKPLGIEITAESPDWTTAKEMVRHVPTGLGTGEYTFLDLYNAFHSDFAGPDIEGLNNTAMYSNPKVDEYIDAMLAATTEEEAIEFAKHAQYDGETGVNVDFPYIWIANIKHTYFVRDGLDLGEQKVHPHGHGVSVIQNVNEWSFEG